LPVSLRYVVAGFFQQRGHLANVIELWRARFPGALLEGFQVGAHIIDFE